MNFIQKSPIWILLFYQLIGFFTIRLIEEPPFYFLFVFTLMAFMSSMGNKKLRGLPGYLTYLMLCSVFVLFSVFVYNGMPFGANKYLTVSLTYVASFLLMYLVASYEYNDKFIHQLIKLMRYTVFLAAAVSIIQYFIPDFLVNTGKYVGLDAQTEGYERRITSFFTWGDGIFSQYLGIGLPAMYAILLFEKESRKRYIPYVAAAVGITIFLSQARFAMVNYLIVTLFWFVTALPSKNRRNAILMAVIMIIAFNVVIEVLDFDFDYFVTNRVESETYMTRIEAFYAAADQIPQNLYFGTGGILTEGLYRFYGRLTRIHNGYLGLWYFYGLFAAITYYLFVFLLTKLLFQGARKTQYWGSVVAMVCFLFSNFTTDKTNFIEPGLILMMVFHYYYMQKYYASQRASIQKPEVVNEALLAT